MPVEEEYHGAATMLVAARVGTTHLIDNTQLVIE
jgi:pantothenate synthetase